MKKRRENRQAHLENRATAKAIALVVLMGSVGSAGAFEIEFDNPDIVSRWDQTVRYNAGWRMKDRDPGLANNVAAQDESDYLFDKNDLINSRVELFSEFDLTYQERMGLRISGQAWYDAAYDANSKAMPGSPVAAQNIKGTFNDETQRFYHGPSGEFLDHFVWIQGEIGDTNVVARFGRHAMIWGEGLFGNTQGVSYAMAPSDGRKSLSSPGATAKETARPINQTTGTWQLKDNLSMSWQYAFEWKSNALALGGTYLGFDAFSSNINFGGPTTIPRVNAEEGEKGAWGLMLKWRPEILGADLGFVYREFSDTNPWAAQLRLAAGVPQDARYVYAQDIKLWGLTFNKTVGSVAVGAEISHRENMALNSRSGAANLGAASRYEGPVGDTWHAILNAQALFNQTALWDTAVLVGELSYAGLDKVTRNAGAYKSKDTAAVAALCSGNDVLNSCSTDDFWSLGVQFQPTWQQVLPGMDMYASGVYVVGLKGTAPTNGGGNESSGQYKFSLGFDYRLAHKLELSYTAFIGKKRYVGAATTKTTVGGGALSDRDWLSATYTYNF